LNLKVKFNKKLILLVEKLKREPWKARLQRDYKHKLGKKVLTKFFFDK
jgi:hypothetical protein